MKENINNSFEVDYRYDQTYDVLVIKVKKPYSYGKTIEMEEGILLDFDKNNVPVLLEILDASKVLNVPKYSLNELLCFYMKVSVSDKLISIVTNFGVLIKDKETSPILESLVGNYFNMPSIEAELISA